VFLSSQANCTLKGLAEGSEVGQRWRAYTSGNPEQALPSYGKFREVVTFAGF